MPLCLVGLHIACINTSTRFLIITDVFITRPSRKEWQLFLIFCLLYVKDKPELKHCIAKWHNFNSDYVLNMPFWIAGLQLSDTNCKSYLRKYPLTDVSLIGLCWFLNKISVVYWIYVFEAYKAKWHNYNE